MALRPDPLRPPTSGAGQKPTLADLAAAFRAINRQTEFDALTSALLQEAVGLFAAEAACLLLVNKTTGEAELAAVHRVPEDALQAYQRRPVRAKAMEVLLDRGNGAESPELSGSTLGGLLEGGATPARWLPIRIQEKTIGYLGLAPRPGDASDLLDLFLEFCAQTIENTYLIYHLRRQNRHLELMTTQLQNTQQHLRHSEKLALVGRLAASVAHEIRNPMTVIGTSLQLVFEKMEPGHPDHSLYASMLGKVRDVDHTIKELLVFARPAAVRIEPVSLASALGRVVTFVGKKFDAHGLILETKADPEAPRILADGERLERVLLNLLLNACQVLPPGGRVRVRAWPAEGRRLLVTVTDNGPGIPPQNRARMFEPFATSRPEGTGLGLFLVKHLLEEMNATIDVVSEPDQGTEFRLSLPLAE